MIRLLIPILLVSTAITHAANKPKVELEVRFLAESAPSDLGPVVLAAGDVRSSPFELPVNNLSQPKTPPAKVFSLWAVEKNASLSTITLPEEGKSFVILLIPSPKGGYSPVVMNSGDPAFKSGDIYFLNIADKTVLGFVGTEKFILPPAKSIILRPRGDREGKFYDVGLGVREEDGDRVLSTTRWPVAKEMRFYVFFHLNPETKLISYRAVDEFVEKVEAPR